MFLLEIINNSNVNYCENKWTLAFLGVSEYKLGPPPYYTLMAGFTCAVDYISYIHLLARVPQHTHTHTHKHAHADRRTDQQHRAAAITEPWFRQLKLLLGLSSPRLMEVSWVG